MAIDSFFATLLDAAPDALVVIDAHRVILHVNRQAQQLFGYSESELVGQPYSLIVPDGLSAAFEGQPPRSRVSHARSKAGRQLSVEVNVARAEFHGAGFFTASFRNRAHQQADALMFEDLLEAAPDALIICDAEGTIHLANSRCEQLFGYTRKELAGMSVEALVPKSFRAAHPDYRARYIAASQPRAMGEGIDLRALHKNGSEFAAEISLSPMATPHGQRTIAAIRDISERRRIEALRRLSLENANRLKSEFLANMSHELRSPLNAIIGFAKLMYHGRVGTLADAHREYIGDILTSSEHLLHLINDVLDLSKVEAGRMEFFPEPVDLAQLVQDVQGSLRAIALAKRITLEVSVCPQCVEAELDPAKLKQVLYNYLSNALKFTSEGGHVQLCANLEDANLLRFEVRDTGPGIREDDIPELFMPFRQLDQSAAKRHQGTGLGLALTRRIVEAQGGRVGVESQHGSGSCFYAVLPRTPIAARTSESQLLGADAAQVSSHKPARATLPVKAGRVTGSP